MQMIFWNRNPGNIFPKTILIWHIVRVSQFILNNRLCGTLDNYWALSWVSVRIGQVLNILEEIYRNLHKV